MPTRLPPVAAGPLVIVLCVSLLKGAQDRPKQANRDEAFFKLRSSQAGRQIGVLLRATAEAVARPGSADLIKIHWTMDYTGPRPPLIILKPDLDHPTPTKLTRLLVYARGKDGRLYEYELTNPTRSALDFAPALAKDWFLTIPKGKTGSGDLTLPADRIGKYFRQQWPEQFGAAPPPLYLQLIHSPEGRGGDGEDAWTGVLHTPVFPVTVKKW
jgi:hypothetical protein